MVAVTELRDKVSVLGKFDAGRLRPVVIRWNGRRYWVKSVNLHHSQRQGTDVVHYFAVTTEAGDCTLAYSREELTWRLTEVSFGG